MHTDISCLYSFLLQTCFQPRTSIKPNMSIMSPIAFENSVMQNLIICYTFHLIISNFFLCYFILCTNREKEDCKNKMSHLQEAVRTHFSSLTSLKQQAAQYRQEKEGENQIFYFVFCFFYYTVWYTKFVLSQQSVALDYFKNSTIVIQNSILLIIAILYDRIFQNFYL